MHEKPEVADIESRVLAVVREVLAIEDEGLSIDSSIREDLAVDSLDQVTLFMALEDEFGGTIPEEQAARLVTLRDVAECIGRQAPLASTG